MDSLERPITAMTLSQPSSSPSSMGIQVETQSPQSRVQAYAEPEHELTRPQVNPCARAQHPRFRPNAPPHIYTQGPDLPNPNTKLTDREMRHSPVAKKYEMRSFPPPLPQQVPHSGPSQGACNPRMPMPPLHNDRLRTQRPPPLLIAGASNANTTAAGASGSISPLTRPPGAMPEPPLSARSVGSAGASYPSSRYTMGSTPSPTTGMPYQPYAAASSPMVATASAHSFTPPKPKVPPQAFSHIKDQTKVYASERSKSVDMTVDSMHKQTDANKSTQFAAFSNNAKPTPRRQYVADNHLEIAEVIKPKELDVEEFEAARMQAAKQPHNPGVQLEFAKRLAEAPNVLASRYIDPQTPSTLLVDPRTEARNRETWTNQAYKITKRLATKVMDVEAIFFLAANYSAGGLGLEPDHFRAFDLYMKAAKLAHAEASYRVAVCYEFGVGIKKDLDKALSWYKKAAHLGDVSSMYKLGMMSLNGSLGQPRNFIEGFTWIQRAAEKADSKTPHAVHELGLLYERADKLESSGLDNANWLKKDVAKAFELYCHAAKLGYAPSKARLGRAFEFGELGCDIDPQKSISWYTNAAQNGDPDAELGLCGWYWTGAEGILRRSDTEAFLWAKKAASRGSARGEFALGYFYQMGIGIPKSISKARMWYSLAADKKHPRAADRLRELESEESDAEHI